MKYLKGQKSTGRGNLLWTTEESCHFEGAVRLRNPCFDLDGDKSQIPHGVYTERSERVRNDKHSLSTCLSRLLQYPKRPITLAYNFDVGDDPKYEHSTDKIVILDDGRWDEGKTYHPKTLDNTTDSQAQGIEVFIKYKLLPGMQRKGSYHCHPSQ